MIFQLPVTFWGQDAAPDGSVRPSVLLDRLEEAGSAEMEACPPSNDDLAARGQAFLLSRIVLRFYRPVHLGNAVAQTFSTDSRGLSFNRCYRLLQDGTTAVEAYSAWALYDRALGRPIRVTEAGEQIGGEPEPPALTDLPLRVPQPNLGEMELLGKRTVYRSDADRNGHLNNTKYLNILCDALPEDRPLRGVNIAFVHEAPLGETLTVYGKQAGDVCYLRTLRADGAINCEAVLYFA